ncbi:MAG TPA: hypothetical protein VJH68_04090 [Candidatus Nanoarchaeia archaeon]|nr:hypothetical protein [Candidatus Nanoarchaeia archaeon]
MKKSGKLFIYLALLFFLFYGLKTIFTGRIVEIVIISALGFLTLLGFMHWRKPGGERLFLFVSLIFMAYLVYVWSLTGALYLTLLFISLVMFLLSFPKKGITTGDDGEPTVSEQPHSVVFEPPKSKDEKSNESIVKEFSPGLYLASSQGAVYHAPTCNWAKKVSASRQIWLQTKDDARGKGYEAHSCVS